MMLLPKVHRGT